MIQQSLDAICSGERLTANQLEGVFNAMLAGELSNEIIAAFLVGWRMQGEGETELSIGAQFLRKHALKPPLSTNLYPLCDNCGTGGDGLHTFNISTAAAIVAATCGIAMAKHGNRSVSSLCGSADLLFAAGFPSDLDEHQAASLLEKTGLTFFFAPQFHPTMRHVMPVRKQLGIRTIFNLLGPLANPISPAYQLVGVSDRRFLKPMAQALQQLGAERAFVVSAVDGLDEISPESITHIVETTQSQLIEHEINPKTLEISAKMQELRGGDAARNLHLLNELLAARNNSLLEAVCLNAGAILWLTRHSNDLKAGYQFAMEKVKSGVVATFFSQWINTAKDLKLERPNHG